MLPTGIGRESTQSTFVERKLLELAKAILFEDDPKKMAARSLALLREIVGSTGAFLYVDEPNFPPPKYFHLGFAPESVPLLNEICRQRFEELSSGTDRSTVIVPLPVGSPLQVALYPLEDGSSCLGVAGYVETGASAGLDAEREEAFELISRAAARWAEGARMERRLRHLNAYVTVSSMLGQSVGLPAMLDGALYCCKEMTSAEEASIMLLDDEKENLFFHEVDGATGAVLVGAKFPATKGVAGNVLQTQEAEIVNDVQNDSRFYRSIDNDSGFRSRNLIAVPLTAGEEKIGVLEVLNRVDGRDFTEEERLALVLVAEEVAFAIRNAKLFEYIVGTYCKQRQGQISCKGCKRPLGSWTPCVKYGGSD